MKKYTPYEEWWHEVESREQFRITLESASMSFLMNMTASKETDKTREEWMEMFLLWLEYKK